MYLYVGESARARKRLTLGRRHRRIICRVCRVCRDVGHCERGRSLPFTFPLVIHQGPHHTQRHNCLCATIKKNKKIRNTKIIHQAPHHTQHHYCLCATIKNIKNKKTKKIHQGCAQQTKYKQNTNKIKIKNKNTNKNKNNTAGPPPHPAPQLPVRNNKK